MCAVLNKGYTFGATESVTNAKLHALVDSATVTGIVNADIDPGAAIAFSKLAEENIDGSKLIGLNNIVSGAGVIPAANLTSVAQKGANTDITSLAGLTGDLYNTAWTSYSATSTVVGWSDFSDKEIWYKKIGKLVFVDFTLTGTSDATSTSFTLPYTISSAKSVYASWGYGVDNGVAITAGGRIGIAPGTSLVNCYKDYATGVWTVSGVKSVNGQFWFEATT